MLLRPPRDSRARPAARPTPGRTPSTHLQLQHGQRQGRRRRRAAGRPPLLRAVQHRAAHGAGRGAARAVAAVAARRRAVAAAIRVATAAAALDVRLIGAHVHLLPGQRAQRVRRQLARVLPAPLPRRGPWRRHRPRHKLLHRLQHHRHKGRWLACRVRLGTPVQAAVRPLLHAYGRRLVGVQARRRGVAACRHAGAAHAAPVVRPAAPARQLLHAGAERHAVAAIAACQRHAAAVREGVPAAWWRGRRHAPTEGARALVPRPRGERLQCRHTLRRALLRLLPAARAVCTVGKGAQEERRSAAG